MAADGDPLWAAFVREQTDRNQARRNLWIAAGSQEAAKRRADLAATSLGAVVEPGVVTIGSLARQVLVSGDGAQHRADSRPCRPLDRVAGRRLLAEIVDKLATAGQLEQHGRVEPFAALLDLFEREVAAAREAGRRPADVAADAERSGGPREREFAAVYNEFHKQLSAGRLRDRPAELAMAADSLRRSPGEGPRWATVFVADGDAVEACERRFLTTVLARAERAVVMVARPSWEAEQDAGRRDATPPTSPIDWLRQAVDEPITEAVVESTDTRPAELAFLNRWLFCDPRDAPAPPAAGGAPGVEVLAGRSASGEFAAVAARVKQRLVAGAAADDVVVAAPSVRVVADRFSEAMAAAGVPIAIELSPRLGDAPLARDLLALLRLPRHDWRHHDLLRVLTTPSLTRFDDAPSDLSNACRRAGFSGPRAAAELAVRRLLLPRGRGTLVDQLARESAYSKSRPGTEGGESRSASRSAVATDAALHAVEQLAAALDALPRSATPLAWHDAMRGLLDALGYHAAASEAESTWSDSATRDLAALDAMESGMASLERLDRWRRRPTATLSRDEATDQLADWAPRLPLDTPQEGEGRVRLLSFESACAERPRHLFAVGLAEGVVPRSAGRPPAGGLERSAAEQGERLRDEMRRFHQLVATPRESLTLSFPALDSAAQPLNPSSFVAEVERLFLPRSLRSEGGDEPDAGPSAARASAVRAAMGGDGEALKRLATDAATAESAESVLDGFAVATARLTGDELGPSEGVLLSGAARRDLAERFGPDHLWSPSQLETYAQCPYQFFLRYALGIEPIDALGVDIDHRRRGALLHDAMLRFHQQMQADQPPEDGLPEDGAPPVGGPADDDRFAAGFLSAVAASAEAAPVSPHERPFARVEAKQAAAWAPLYRRQLDAYTRDTAGLDGPMRAAFFEARFGPRRGGEDPSESDAVLSTDEPLRLPLGDELLLLTGRIDRIDLAESGGEPVFNVIDYKTGASVQSRVEGVRSGRQLQLFLYALAAERLLLHDRGAKPWRLGYWAVRNDGFKPPREQRRELRASEPGDDGRPRPTAEWRELEDAVVTRLRSIVAGIRNGQFPMLCGEEGAGRCDYVGVCQGGHAAMALGKAPPAPTAEAPA